jgi:NAD(P)-dependent dehydrogenase (short-subunit alcohol dehydrogenase family)
MNVRTTFGADQHRKGHRIEEGDMNGARVVVIGAAGEMASSGVQRLAALDAAVRLELYDLDVPRLHALAELLPQPPALVGPIDLFDPARLRNAIAGADLVVLGAGPYLRTAPPVMRACIELGVDYLDFDDDIESTQDALALHDAARLAGMALFVGCGASPGMSNLLAVDAASRLDEVDTIDVCWVSGDEGPRPYGAAVIEHIFHIGAGDAQTWRDGGPMTVETFVANEVFPLGGDLGDYRLYETAHPEAVTLPRRYPQARSIRVMGGGHPQPINGMLRGVSLAVHRGRLSVPEGIAWLQAVMNDQSGSLRGWRHALAGMVGQVRRGECSPREVARFLRAGLRHEHEPYRGALLARVTGVRLGNPATVIVRTPTGGPDSEFASSMGAVTGTCLAAFTALALERRGTWTGALAPEDWVEPGEFYATLERLGIPRHEVLASEPVVA